MPNQSLIPPQTLTEKMNAGYPKRTTGGSGGTVVTTSSTSETAIVTEQTRARLISNTNITLSGLQPIDNVTMAELDVIIVNGQTDKTENGLYIADESTWTRHSQEIYGGLTVSVTDGDSYRDTLWIVSTPNNNADLGLSEIVFSEISASIALRTSEESASDKLAFAWKLITELSCQLQTLISEKTYEVVCHVNDLHPTTAFTVPTGVPTPIPFYSVLYNPTDGLYSAGYFTAGKTGYYDVDCHYYDTIAAPVTRVWIGISGYNSDITGGSAVINTDFFELQASRKVFCNAGGTISAFLFHNYGADIVFNNHALDEHGNGYISIHYCGSTKAATNI